MAAVMNPPMPYMGPLVCPCSNGFLLQVHGFVPHQAQRFAVNFVTASGDIALHFNPRFDENVIVMNTRQFGNWQAEQRVSIGSLARGRDFELKLLVDNGRFMIAVNGQHHCEFGYRMPAEAVTGIEVQGDLNAKLIYQTSAHAPAPLFNPPMPLTTPIAGGFLPGRKVMVCGIMTGSAFSINLQNGPQPFQNVALHLNPRMNEHCLVFNDCTNGGWGGEERHGLSLSPGQQFTIEILCHHHGYEARVNGASIGQLGHRNMSMRPLQSIDTLYITGDVQVQQIFFG